MTARKKQPFKYVYVVELDHGVASRRWVRDLNPSARSDLPCVAVWTGMEHPERAFADGTFEASGLSVIRSNGLRLLPDFTTRFRKREGGLSKVARMVSELRMAGHAVANTRPKKSHHVYVVELSSRADDASSERAHAASSSALPELYVGQTGLTPARRFAQHKAGDRLAARATRGRCVRLRPDLYAGLNPMTELDSLRGERSLRRRLERAGYRVHGGH